MRLKNCRCSRSLLSRRSIPLLSTNKARDRGVLIGFKDVVAESPSPTWRGWRPKANVWIGDEPHGAKQWIEFVPSLREPATQRETSGGNCAEARLTYSQVMNRVERFGSVG